MGTKGVVGFVKRPLGKEMQIKIRKEGRKCIRIITLRNPAGIIGDAKAVSCWGGALGKNRSNSPDSWIREMGNVRCSGEGTRTVAWSASGRKQRITSEAEPFCSRVCRPR